MEAKPILLLTAVICLFFGISLLLVPEMILNMNGMSTLGNEAFAIQHTGCMVFATGILIFLIRNEEHSNIRQGIFLFMIIGLGLLTIVDIIGFFMAYGSVMMWMTIGLHILLIALFMYLYLQNR
ncbi:MAG: hypothetical protein KAU48_01180 [Candidatus Thorarchaeota archaeon]|nr:hypothetical protein [Candidatus Thorarchaeota archaeon]